MSQKDDVKRALVLYGDGRPDTLYYMSTADTPTAVNSPTAQWASIPVDCIHDAGAREAAPNPFLCRHEQPLPSQPLPAAPTQPIQPIPVQHIHVQHVHQNTPASNEHATAFCQCCAQANKDKKKKKKMHPILKGVAILVVGPFAMAGAGVVAAGSVVYATGYLIMGIGDVLTGGPLKGVAKRAWKERKNRD